MRWMLAVLLLTASLAGCLGGDEGEQPEDIEAMDHDDMEEGMDHDQPEVSYAADNGTEEDPEMANATVGDEHMHDAWGTGSELILFEGTVEAGECQDTFRQVIRTAIFAALAQEVNYGCVFFTFADGVIVPEGTESITVAADATAALQGGYQNWIRTANDEEVVGEVTEEPVHEWTHPVTAEDWDLPHQGRSGYYVAFQARGDVSRLEGPIQVTVTAHKLPGWQPVVAKAHVQHWDLENKHTFVRDNVALLHMSQESHSFPGWAQQVQGGEWPEDIQLQDIVLPGTRQLVLVESWSAANCGATSPVCRPDSILRTGGDRAWPAQEETGDTWSIKVFDVPDDVGEDSTYAEASQTWIRPNIQRCLTEDPFTMCMGADQATAEVTYHVEAWRGGVDLQDVKTRLGLQ